MPKENDKKIIINNCRKTLGSKSWYRHILLKNYSLGVKVHHICFFISVLLVSILAGLRDYTVGTDIESYGNPLFYYATQYQPFTVYLKRFSHIEPLYLGLVYFSAFFSEEPHILYFFTGILIYSFIMAGFVRMKNYISITLAWLGFLCLLYGDTYNAMRQSIAIAIGFWSFSFFTEKKYVYFSIGLIVGFLFHNTVIIYFAIALIYIILKKNNSITIKILLAVGATVGLVMFNNILEFLMGTGLLQDKMERYLIEQNNGLSVFAILIRIPFLVLIQLQKHKFWSQSYHTRGVYAFKDENEGDFYIILLFVEMFTVEMSAFVPSLYRISLFFIPFRCLAYSRICTVQIKDERVRYSFVLLLYLLIIFIYQNQIKGNNEIYPYILGDF